MITGDRDDMTGWVCIMLYNIIIAGWNECYDSQKQKKINKIGSQTLLCKHKACMQHWKWKITLEGGGEWVLLGHFSCACCVGNWS